MGLIMVFIIMVKIIIIIIITRDRENINNDRIAATMYSLRTWFVSGICAWIPYIKETMMMIMIMIIIIIIILCINTKK